MKPVRPVCLLAAGFLFAPGCAKKLPPSSPDRFAPYLIETDSRSRVQLELAFDEPINPTRLEIDSFVLTGPGDLEKRIRGVAVGRSADRVLVWTEPLTVTPHLLRGVVWDDAGNPCRFRVGFRPSPLADTVEPRIREVRPSPGAARLKTIPVIAVSFSEPMDTAITPCHMFAPKAVETLYVRKWSGDWQRLEFVYQDTARRTGAVYFIMGPGARDFGGNATAEPSFTYFTQDTVFSGVSVEGRVIPTPGRGGFGVVYFDRGETRAMAPMRADGSFRVSVDTGTWQVRAVADTNRDGLADLVAPYTAFMAPGDSLVIGLLPETLPAPINAYRR